MSILILKPEPRYYLVGYFKTVATFAAFVEGYSEAAVFNLFSWLD
jgi:hypothetical protein